MNFSQRYNLKSIFSSLFALLCLVTHSQSFTHDNLFAAQNKGALYNYLNEIEVGDAIAYKNLKIFPIRLKREISTKNYVTLDEASEKKWLKIKELKSAAVNIVQVKNKGTKPVFMMIGEVIKGAKQDRMIKQDILLQPGTWTKVPVFCVEHGRWAHVSSEFQSAFRVVPSSIRKTAEIHEDQGSVWSKISSVQKSSGVSSPTGTIMANYEDENTKEKIDEYAKQLGRFPHLSKQTIGVVVTTGDKIVCFDLFANNNLLSKLWNKLVESYAFDGIYGKRSTVEKKEVEDFIGDIVESQKNAVKTKGLGKTYKLQSDVGKGSALVDEASVVHMDFFLHETSVDSDSSSMNFQTRRVNRLNWR